MQEYWRFLRTEASFLLYGLALTFLSSFGQTYFISLFLPFLLLEFALTNGEFGSLYAAATLGSACLLPWTGKWMDRTTLTRFTLGIVALLGVSAILMAGANHLMVLFAGLLGLRLAGPGLASYTALAAMARHYSVERGRALGFSSLGFPLGEAILPILGLALISALSWRVSWVLVAGVVFLGFGLLLPALLARSRADVGPAADLPPAPLDSWIRTDGPPILGSEPSVPAIRQWTRREMLHDPRFWFALPAALLPAFWATGIFLYQTGIAEQKGWSLTVMASAFTVFALTRIGFSLVAGGLVDRFTARRIYPLSLLPLAVGLTALVAFSSVWVPYLFMALLGVTTGMNGNVRAALLAELYGVRNLGSIKALMAALMAVSTAGSPILVGVVIDAGAGLDGLLWGSVVSVVVGSALTIRVLRD